MATAGKDAVAEIKSGYLIKRGTYIIAIAVTQIARSSVYIDYYTVTRRIYSSQCSIDIVHTRLQMKTYF